VVAFYLLQFYTVRRKWRSGRPYMVGCVRSRSNVKRKKGGRKGAASLILYNSMNKLLFFFFLRGKLPKVTQLPPLLPPNPPAPRRHWRAFEASFCRHIVFSHIILKAPSLYLSRYLYFFPIPFCSPCSFFFFFCFLLLLLLLLVVRCSIFLPTSISPFAIISFFFFVCVCGCAAVGSLYRIASLLLLLLSPLLVCRRSC
jgi:hypothetical protein